MREFATILVMTLFVSIGYFHYKINQTVSIIRTSYTPKEQMNNLPIIRKRELSAQAISEVSSITFSAPEARVELIFSDTSNLTVTGQEHFGKDDFNLKDMTLSIDNNKLTIGFPEPISSHRVIDYVITLPRKDWKIYSASSSNNEHALQIKNSGAEINMDIVATCVHVEGSFKKINISLNSVSDNSFYSYKSIIKELTVTGKDLTLGLGSETHVHFLHLRTGKQGSYNIADLGLLDRMMWEVLP